MDTSIIGCREWARNEFGRAHLGDKRRTSRLVDMATAFAAKPGKPLPEVFGNWTELKAAYRFVDNDEATYERVIAPHIERTRDACRRGGEHLLVEDTPFSAYSPWSTRGTRAIIRARTRGPATGSREGWSSA